ncbi:MAG: hypothetical protein DWQ31_05280 [Planctomycetota bacterium]|mgnify:CR=1 FL=1|nr:MAG: hypothetical protein DWQ31_05280 [Planctomycetota bacterium]REJ97602.1 MAG: hypothetical protein DWQ35_01690 [Planctomycetota bacterium]REK23024.1 MAG: hypothetical protein DWQ42_15990 [Planctomycetota bacterium]REK43387.1 MAG: hypothetical protein DWQ46_11690 [Planctomycetota bacterium]
MQTGTYYSDDGAAQSVLSWMFESLGSFHAFLLTFVSFVLFVAACVLVCSVRRPSVIAAFLVFVPLPLLLGLAGTLHQLIDSFRLAGIVDPTDPFGPEVTINVAATLVSTFVGLMLTFPSLIVLGLGLLLRTALWKPPSDD